MGFIWRVVFCALFVCSYAQSHFHEPCPSDSVQIEDVCSCDHTLCDQPSCETTLVQLTNLTNTPGSCCPTYSCEGCKEEDEIEGMCPCLPGAVLRFGRKCECANDHYTLINGTCQCDVGRCPLPDLCDRGSVAVKEFDGCCEKIKCVQCPDDSYPTSYNDPFMEDKCVCYPCSPIKCNENQSLRILRKGKNVPGTCCDFYSCNNGCLVNGTMYADGEAWFSGDGNCKCQNGISHCSPVDDNQLFKSCLSGDKVYHHLETWVEDSCTNCTCENGNSKCIAHMCDIYVSEVKPPFSYECPSLSTCRKICENGFKLNKQGCEICKCRAEKVAGPKSNKLDVLFAEYNLTEDDVIVMVKGYIALEKARSTTSTTTSTSSTTAAPSTTICITQNKSIRGDCTYSCILEYGIPGFVVGAIFAAILLFTFLKCSEKNRQKYKMHYNYKPVGKETLDKNLNISPIINSKNFELKSYNEKKNVI